MKNLYRFTALVSLTLFFAFSQQTTAQSQSNKQATINLTIEVDHELKEIEVFDITEKSVLQKQSLSSIR